MKLHGAVIFIRDFHFFLIDALPVRNNASGLTTPPQRGKQKKWTGCSHQCVRGESDASRYIHNG